MMLRLLPLVAVLATLALLAMTSALDGPHAGAGEAEQIRSVEGVWLVANEEAHVELRSCGVELCGEIVWLREPYDEDGHVRRDVNNPDESLRHRRILGLEILQGLRPSPDHDGLWIGGTIYDPESGRTYSCKVRRDGENHLKMRGFWGISLLGRTTRWTRVPAAGP